MKEGKIKKLESAVSPVIGVLLMLVVTIIIAAIVSGFAGGLAGDTQKTPQVSIEAKIYYTPDSGMGTAANMTEFKHLSGDSVPSKDLAIITYYTNKTGYTYRHEQTASSNKTFLYSYYGSDYNVRLPYLNDMRQGYAGAPGNYAPDFGNYTWKVGDVLTTGGDAGTADLLGINDGSSPHKILDPDFGSGSVVSIKILHIPSKKYIFDKEVVVA